MNFYETDQGQNILDSRFWPKKLEEYLAMENIFLSERIKYDSSVLDVGSGKCRNLMPLSARCRKLVGIDYSKAMVECSQRIMNSMKLENVQILNQDIVDSDFSQGSFDYIICMFNTFGNMGSSTQNIFLKKVRKYLNDEGRLFLSVYSENAKDTQIEFYNNIGLKLIRYDEDFVYTENFISERFSETKIRKKIEKNGLRIIDLVKLNDVSLILDIDPNKD